MKRIMKLTCAREIDSIKNVGTRFRCIQLNELSYGFYGPINARMELIVKYIVAAELADRLGHLLDDNISQLLDDWILDET